MLTAKEARLLLNVGAMNQLKKDNEERIGKAIKDSIKEIEDLIKHFTESGFCSALYPIYSEISADIIGILQDSGYKVINLEGLNQYQRVLEISW